MPFCQAHTISQGSQETCCKEIYLPVSPFFLVLFLLKKHAETLNRQIPGFLLQFICKQFIPPCSCANIIPELKYLFLPWWIALFNSFIGRKYFSSYSLSKAKEISFYSLSQAKLSSLEWSVCPCSSRIHLLEHGGTILQIRLYQHPVQWN